MRTPRQAARVALPDSTGSVFLFRYDDEEVGVHWAMPGGAGSEPGVRVKSQAAFQQPHDSR
ncbi:hypothetical protein [Streptomyces rimosus]|uniref:hypothetical protein n=1 Tax=Streptomyces rimosus TaxID=1927 RepID=UPI0037CE7F27